MPSTRIVKAHAFSFSRSASHRRWTDRVDDLEQAAHQLIRRQGARSALVDLSAALAAEAANYGGDCRLQDLHYALLHPFEGAQLADELADDMHPANHQENRH